MNFFFLLPAACLPEFSRLRVPDDHAISDLAMYNYVEVGEPHSRALRMHRAGRASGGPSPWQALASELLGNVTGAEEALHPLQDSGRAGKAQGSSGKALAQG